MGLKESGLKAARGVARRAGAAQPHAASAERKGTHTIEFHKARVARRGGCEPLRGGRSASRHSRTHTRAARRARASTS